MVQSQASPSINPALETIEVQGLSIRFLVTGEQSNGNLALFEMVVPAGSKLPAPPHSHDGYEETAYGIEGSLTWTVDGRPFEVGPGQSLCIPRGAVHRFENNGSASAKQLAAVTPAKIGPEYFREVAAALKEAGGGPPDRAKIMEILHRHGLTPALPGS